MNKIDKIKIEEKIRKLAPRVQLEIKKAEMSVYLETLTQLEQLLVNFRKVKLPEKTKPLVRIATGSLTINDLKKLAEKISGSASVSSRSHPLITFKHQRE